MAFDAHLYFPQWQGGPNHQVRRGGRFIYDILAGLLPFHEITTDASEGALAHDIKHYAPILANLQQCAGWLKAHNPRTVFMLGGDCSIDVAVVDHLSATHGKSLGVIWIDAHADIHEPKASETKNFHGMPLRLLLGEGDEAMLAALNSPLSHGQLCYGGIRSIDVPEQDYINQHRLPVLSAADINEGNYETFLKWREENAIKHLHIHLDLDALDPEEHIAVTYHVPGGIRLAAMAQFLRFLHGQAMTVGFTFTEYAASEEKPEELDKIMKLMGNVLPLPSRWAA